jgi:hypothetical protein
MILAAKPESAVSTPVLRTLLSAYGVVAVVAFAVAFRSGAEPAFLIGALAMLALPLCSLYFGEQYIANHVISRRVSPVTFWFGVFVTAGIGVVFFVLGAGLVTPGGQ